MATVVLNSVKEFEKAIAENKTVLIDFHAVWCGPCRMQGPIVDAIANENEDIFVGKVDVDEVDELAYKFGVSSIPTLLIFKDGKLTKQYVGLTMKDRLLADLK